jgi:hypothetical protein
VVGDRVEPTGGFCHALDAGRTTNYILRRALKEIFVVRFLIGRTTNYFSVLLQNS